MAIYSAPLHGILDHRLSEFGIVFALSVSSPELARQFDHQ